MRQEPIKLFSKAAIALLMMLFTTLTAWAQGVDYRDANGVLQTCEDIEELTINTDENTRLSGWYVASETNSITTTGVIDLQGDTHIILCDGVTLTINVDQMAIIGSKGSLTIYGGDKGTGKLIIQNATQGLYGIRCNNLTVNGGTLDIMWITNYMQSAIAVTNFTLNAGSISVKVVESNGTTEISMGKGLYATNCNINNGTLYATGYSSSSNVVFGKPFVSGGTLMSASDIAGMAGKTMTPAADGAYKTVTVPAHVTVTGSGIGYGGNNRYFVPTGGSITLSADEGYAVSNISSTGGTVSGNTISGINSNITVTANVEARVDAVYTITYELYGGRLPDGQTNPTTYQYNTPTFTLVNPIKDGYNFGGWFGTGLPSGISGTKTVTIEQGSTGDREYTVFWNALNYSITYHANGGTMPDGYRKNYYITDADVTLCEPTRAGYFFYGWYDNEGLTGTAITSIPHGSTGNKEFWAKWINSTDFSQDGNTYYIHTADGWGVFCDALDDNDRFNRFSGKTVKLAGNIGSAQAPITRMAGKSKHDFCGTFDGQGYTLTVDISSSNDRDYTAPFSYVSNTTPVGGSEDSPAAICNLNVAGNVTATKDYASGLVGAFWGTLTIENCTSSAAINTNNKHAAGFISRAQGSATITNCLSSVTITGTISGDGTHAGFIGGSASGVTTNITGCAFNGSLLGTSTTHCAGFVGYNSGTLTITNSLFAPASVTVGSDGSATFARGNAPTLTNTYCTQTLGSVQGAQVYSITTGDEYLTTLDINGTPTNSYTVSGLAFYNTGFKCGDVIYAGSDDAVNLTFGHSNRPGYRFDHYTISAGSASGATLTMPSQDVTVGTAWNIITYSISYDLNGGSLPQGKSNPNSYNIESADITLIAPTKDNYVFGGWYANDAFTGNVVTTITAGSYGNMNLFAKWTPVTYSISYDLAGGELPEGKSNPSSYNVESADITLNVPVKVGYTFAGWTGTDLTEPTYEVTIANGSAGNREYTATWVSVQSVSYHDENGDQQTVMALALDGTETTLAPGWYFVQNTNPNGVDLVYNNGLSCADGDLNIILCDGAEMTVTGAEDENAINFSNAHTLTIYGQSDGTGRLTLTGGESEDVFVATNIVINGGNINATNVVDGYDAIDVNGSLTINGGTVSATSVTTSPAIRGTVILNNGQLTVSNTYDNNDYAYAFYGDLTVNGGQFVASSNYGYTVAGTTTRFNGGTFSATNTYSSAVASYNVYLNWTSSSDSFYASSFDNVSAEIAEGKAFIADGETYSGLVYGGDISNKTLRPYDAPLNLATANITLTSATLTWDAFDAETQWQVKWSTDDGDTWSSPVTVNQTQYTITGLTPGTTVKVQVLSIYGDDDYSHPATCTFTTHLASDAPVDLANAVTATTAALSWTGFQEGYNVRYATTNVILSQGFEGGSMPDGWSRTGDYWNITSGTGYDGYTGAATGSYNAGCIIEDREHSDMLISPAMDLSSSTSVILTFNFWNTNWSGDINTLNVKYRVNGGDWNQLYTNDQEVSPWTPVKVTLEGIAANYQIGFECVGNYSYGMGIDDVVVTGINEWTNENNVTGPLTLTGLTPETSYLWQVQGILGNGVTEWSTGTFTTIDGTDIVLYNSGSEAEDNASAIDDNAGHEVNVILLGRTLYKDGDWNTLCLPFNLGDDEAEEGHHFDGTLLEGATVMTLASTGFEDGTLTLNFTDATSIEAGKPYIVKWTTTGDDLVNPVFTDVTISNATANVSTANVDFIGTYGSVVFAAGTAHNDVLFLGSCNSLYYPDGTATTTIGACRAYFTLADPNATVKAFNLNFGDEDTQTGIRPAESAESAERAGAWYDLSGRKIVNGKSLNHKLPNGIYLNNGRKVVIK